MSMTIFQANKVNVLLDWLLQVEPQYRDISRASFDEAREAAVFLADAANKALSAGLNGDQVGKLWDAQNAKGALRKRRAAVKS